MAIRRAVRALRRVVFVLSGASLAVACVAESEQAKNGSGTPTGPGTQPGAEVARQSVGPQGGTVSGGGATIDIPAGALPSDTTIVIKTVDPASVTLPKTSSLAGSVYAFEPDDVQFLKPVSITVDVDPAKHSPNGTGALVLLRSPTGANQWTVRGATNATAPSIVATTTHFSNWVASSVGEASCFFKNACMADASPGAPVGIECKVPASGGGVHCAGNAAPYECTCDGQTDVIASLEDPPGASLLSAMAVACGATCDAPPDAGPNQCTVGASCNMFTGAPPDAGQSGPGPGGWFCSTTSTTQTIHCDYTNGDSQATCYCDPSSMADAGVADASAGGGGGGGNPPATFSIPATGEPPTDAEVIDLWKSHCGGVCQSPPRRRPGDAGADAAADSGTDAAADGGIADAAPPPPIDAGK